MPALDLNPRGLRRVDAARYIGISPTLFDTKRKEGAIPPPRDLFGVMIWDRHDLDSLFAKPVYSAANDNDDYWDRRLAAKKTEIRQ